MTYQQSRTYFGLLTLASRPTLTESWIQLVCVDTLANPTARARSHGATKRARKKNEVPSLALHRP